MGHAPPPPPVRRVKQIEKKTFNVHTNNHFDTRIFKNLPHTLCPVVSLRSLALPPPPPYASDCVQWFEWPYYEFDWQEFKIDREILYKKRHLMCKKIILIHEFSKISHPLPTLCPPKHTPSAHCVASLPRFAPPPRFWMTDRRDTQGIV